MCTKARLLGERSVRIREVNGSNPSRSTNLPHRFVRCGVFYVQKPLADRAGLRTLKLDANRTGFPGGVPGTGNLQAAESGLHSPARMRYTILEVITMRRKFWLLAAVCLLVCLLAGCGSKEQTVTPDFVLTYADNQPADYPTTQGAERFAALVKERTGGIKQSFKKALSAAAERAFSFTLVESSLPVRDTATMQGCRMVLRITAFR